MHNKDEIDHTKHMYMKGSNKCLQAVVHFASSLFQMALLNHQPHTDTLSLRREREIEIEWDTEIQRGRDSLINIQRGEGG